MFKSFIRFQITIFFIGISFLANAQIGIGTTTPDASAALDITSTNKGLLIPRMTAYPSSPVVGLTIYRTDLNGFYSWNGTVWSQDVFGVNIYSADGSLSSARTITMAANNLTFSSTTGNLIFNPSSTGKIGIGTTTPASGLDLKSSLGLPSTTTSAATYSVTATDAMVYLTSSSNQAITLPTASAVSGRIYYFINNTSSSKTITSYSALDGSSSTSIASNTSIALQSDGSVWRQFQFDNISSSNTVTSYYKTMTNNVSHVTWIYPWTKLALSDLDIVVPAGKTLFAEYLLLGQTSVTAFPPTNLQVRGYTSGDHISGSLIFNKSANVDVGEEIFVFSNDVPDTDANYTVRVVDSEYPNTNVQPMMLKVRYKNNTASSVTFGYSFGGDQNLTSTGTTISILAGSTVTYSIY
jgi:hypothetical protein